MKNGFLAAILTALMVIMAAPPLLAATPPEGATEEQIAADAFALERGKQLFAHDQAAAVSSVALRKLIDFADHPEVRGYLTVPEKDRTIAVVFYSELDGAHYEFARFVVDGVTVKSGRLIDTPEDNPLSGALERQARSRAAALAYAAQQGAQMCGQASANTVVLPETDTGTVPVYILSGPTRPGRYPLGGHYLVEIDKDYQAATGRAFADQCFDGPIMPADPSIGPELFNVTHRFDNQPTEIHYFAHLHMKVPLQIAANNRFWTIDLTVDAAE